MNNGFIKPLSSVTLQQLGSSPIGEGVQSALHSLGKGLHTQYDRRRQQEIDAREAEVSGLRKTVLEGQIDEAEYKSQARTKAINATPPGKKGTSDDWREYARTQEYAGFTSEAKRAHNFATLLDSPHALPDAFKNYPEIAKLTYLKNKAVAEGDDAAAHSYAQRVKKLSTVAPTKPSPPKLESSSMTAKNLMSIGEQAGVELEGTEAQALGNLSRDLTERLKGKVTQGQVNQYVIAAYKELASEQDTGFDWRPDDTILGIPYPTYKSAQPISQEAVQNRVLENMGLKARQTNSDDDLIRKHLP